MKTTKKVLYNRGLLDNYKYGNAHEELKYDLLNEVNDRRTPDLEKVNDVIQ